VLHFEQIEDGAAKRLVIWQRGTALRLERTDAETAKVIKQTIADRIKDRIPAPGSQKALRRMLDTGRAGNPNYDQMSPEFAQIARGQLSYWQIVGQYFVRSCRSNFCASAIRDGTSTKFSMRMTFISTVSPWVTTARSTALARQVLQRTNAPWHKGYGPNHAQFITKPKMLRRSPGRSAPTAGHIDWPGKFPQLHGGQYDVSAIGTHLDMNRLSVRYVTVSVAGGLVGIVKRFAPGVERPSVRSR